MRYRILVVEDHPLLLTDTTHTLASLGPHRVDGVSSGTEALRLLSEVTYDLVLSDLHMPDIDGLSLIEQWPTHAHSPALALISSDTLAILSGVSQAAKARGISVLGAYTKPFTQRCAQALLRALATHQQQFTAARPPCHTHSNDLLRAALHTQAIQAWYQPKYSMAEKKIVGVEALARWEHPRLGQLPPSAFLPDIEREALHEELLYCMLQQSIAAQQYWQALGHDITVSINLHTRLLDDLTLPERLYAYVLAANAKPASITFELTEHTTTLDTGHYYSGATRLRMMGFALSQDDFGTGYSSFYRLLSTPFTELKLDHSLLHNALNHPHFRTALQSLIRLGNDLGLAVVAEGVETPQEAELVQHMGGDIIQGYVISPPIRHDAVAALLANSCVSPLYAH
ncbi:EAL domain-containing protein [Paenalcaligenes sp. Me131]|uniref:EAL domain-containing response regulator n=1 Tax=Paenalcaligenes sp. Me131 TaxID=3392636 RepID=UPI003D2BB13A